jgi:hypothetical protein
MAASLEYIERHTGDDTQDPARVSIEWELAMKLGTILAALTVATVGTGTALAQPQSRPPMPKPAAGALPNPNPNAVQKTFRSQAPEEQQSSARAAPIDPGQSGRARVASQNSTPPTPRPAAGALPNPNPNAVQKTFRIQNPSERQSSASASPAELGQSGRTRQPE